MCFRDDVLLLRLGLSIAHEFNNTDSNKNDGACRIGEIQIHILIGAWDEEKRTDRG